MTINFAMHAAEQPSGQCGGGREMSVVLLAGGDWAKKEPSGQQHEAMWATGLGGPVLPHLPTL